MNESSGKAAAAEPTILLVDDDVVARTAVASYLRECGFQVMESDTEADGKKLLESKPSAFDIAICATSEASAASRLEFARWLRAKHPHIRVLVAASIAKTAQLAADICEEGPHLRKPYEHQALLDWIKRLRAPPPRQ